MCPRCHSLLPAAEDSALQFCAHCGAPQVRLSEELRALAQSQMEPADSDTASARSATAENQSLVLWKPLMRLAAVVSTAFALFTVMLPPLGLLTPAVTLSLYAGRYRQTRITPSLGARIGLLCGLMVVSAVGVVTAATCLVLRLRTTQMAVLDAGLAAQIQQMHDSIAARSGADPSAAAGATAMLSIPEFRSGLTLGGCALTAAFFLVAITLSGALAGLARSRSRSRLSL